MAVVGFDNFPTSFLNSLIFVTLEDIVWFYSTTFFNSVNIMFIKVFASSLSLIIILFPSISLLSKNCLFARNDLMKVQKSFYVVMLLYSYNVVEERFYIFSS